MFLGRGENVGYPVVRSLPSGRTMKHGIGLTAVGNPARIAVKSLFALTSGNTQNRHKGQMRRFLKTRSGNLPDFLATQRNWLPGS